MESAIRQMNCAMNIADADLPEVPLDPVIQKVLDGDPKIRHLDHRQVARREGRARVVAALDRHHYR